ncbi:arginine/serine-rich coiled-coil protein 2 isoform X2 [Vigna unguiculata]|uniref:Lysine-rich nucleolar protein 1 n=1 Tax=Vigna unguiculata TaxID=3917 RepID=A0A4D6MWF1_VIGUN|nr:arginine/serine-rich coiled-coil protein 2 isoform X2 [Vigna unguiculata]QCE05763.1 Lysine-rich nucleolar protein 1 [Vigna unguiculata]
MTDSNSPLLPHGNSDAKNAFRKPSGDAASRNYRRRSPVDGSPSPDDNPRHGHSSSPNPVRENSSRVSHHYSRKYDDDREQDQQYGRNHYGRSSDSLRNPDRQSSKSSHGHSRRDKYANEDRYRERLISRSGHESRDDRLREESDIRSKNYHRSVDKYSHDKYDRPDHRSKEKRRETYLDHKKYKEIDSYEKSASSKKHDEVERDGLSLDWDGRNERRESRRSSGDYNRNDHSEARNQREDSSPHRDNGKFSLKEKESNDQNIPWKDKRKHDTEVGKGKDWKTRKEGEQCAIEDKETSGKKLKLFDTDRDENNRKDGTEAHESKTSSSKLSHESKADSLAAKSSGFDGDNDLDAAKIAAMRAAELVNRNLVGAGCLTTDQKKKLLWGSKKSTPTEESGHRWDTAMFSDRDRQEKFNKLMGMKGEAKVEQNSNNQSSNDILRAEKQKELQIDLEKQYTAGLRRRDGRTVGLGL